MSIQIHLLRIFAAPKQSYKLTTEQRTLLTSKFGQNPYATEETSEFLHANFGLEKDTVLNWFKHHRAIIRNINVQISWQGKELLAVSPFISSYFHVCLSICLAVSLSLSLLTFLFYIFFSYP